MTWNGAPFDGDTLVASGPGVQTFEGLMVGGLATWSAEVEANFTEQPQWTMEALDPACHGEPGWVSWAIDEASAVFWNGDTLPVVGELTLSRSGNMNSWRKSSRDVPWPRRSRLMNRTVSASTWPWSSPLAMARRAWFDLRLGRNG